jgi:hypothetical protein
MVFQSGLTVTEASLFFTGGMFLMFLMPILRCQPLFLLVWRCRSLHKYSIKISPSVKEKWDKPVTQFGAAPEGLHLRLLVAQLLGAPSHAPHLPEATSLVRRLLHSGGVHQMEGALVLVVVVRVLAAGAELRRILVCTQKHY